MTRVIFILGELANNARTTQKSGCSGLDSSSKLDFLPFIYQTLNPARLSYSSSTHFSKDLLKMKDGGGAVQQSTISSSSSKRFYGDSAHTVPVLFTMSRPLVHSLLHRVGPRQFSSLNLNGGQCLEIPSNVAECALNLLVYTST